MNIIPDISVFYIISKHCPLTTTSLNFVAHCVKINQSFKVFVLWLTHTSQFRSCLFFSPLSKIITWDYSIRVYTDFPWCSRLALHVIIHLKARKCIGDSGLASQHQPHLARAVRVRTQSKFLYDQPIWFIDEEECLQIKTISECKQIFTSAKWMGERTIGSRLPTSYLMPKDCKIF